MGFWTRIALIIDLSMLIIFALSTLEKWLLGHWWSNWEFWAMGFAAAVFGVWPTWKWLRYVRRRRESAHGWSAGDRVLLDCERGTLVSHPLLRRGSDEPNLEKWLVEMDDGRQLEDVHIDRLKKLSAIDRLGDLVRYLVVAR